MGPRGTRAGDEVCVFLGTTTVPTILRRQADGTYLFVGECFVQGIEDGKVMNIEKFRT